MTLDQIKTSRNPEEAVSKEIIDWMWNDIDIHQPPSPKKSKFTMEVEKKLKIKMQRKNRLRYKEIKRLELLQIQIEKESGEDVWYSSRNGIPP